MLFKSALATGLLAADAAARCASPAPSAQQLAKARQFGVLEAELLQTGASTDKGPVEIDVYMHSVSANPSHLLSDKAFKDQFDVLAGTLVSYGFHMNLVKTARTVNAEWGNPDNVLTMQKALRQGHYRDLNLYFVDKIDDQNNTGSCYLPDIAPEGTDEFFRDGCLLLYGSEPGGALGPGYNLGKTAIHEFGHWLGLMHTFEGGCTGKGDGIADTPAQESASSGCPVGRDSCPTMPGLDPIHNFMDYSNDDCYESFTPDQKARMHSSWNHYRAGK
ncbi:hypothetical protein E4U42_004005 [Claviceps africana]|uniref:Peptidase M43 pregnancy-associated plasma-A domain-containing protein n=1 Tax=Claviceps africana TaxID=83212 RepID=A0A8K0J6B9_9HYPO|nr:hypothetical protein E4U42_004005 [Claviceps africana]